MADISKDVANAILARVEAIRGLSIGELFDGVGIFHEGVLFGFVDNAGTAFLRTTPTSARRYARLGGAKHPEMPYWKIPRAALRSEWLLLDLTCQAAAAAHQLRTDVPDASVQASGRHKLIHSVKAP